MAKKHPILKSLTYGWADGESGYGAAMNFNLKMLGVLLNLVVESRDLQQPPEKPNEGNCYIVGAGATGLWKSYDNYVACWIDGAWDFYFPPQRQKAYDQSKEEHIIFKGSSWIVEL